MVYTDIATRTWDHGWRLDPIVRSLLDTDFYKLLMLQLIWRRHRTTRATFALINRTQAVRLAEVIDEAELRAQLDHARSLRFAKKELIWLAGNSFYGEARMFAPDFLAWLADFRLPEYELRTVDGQFELCFAGPWTHTTMWEIPALAIVNELRARAALRGKGRFTLDVLYARAKAKLWDKVERLRALPDLALSDFGTRRRHGFLWQRWCVEALKEGLGARFIGTSNVLLAMDHDLEAIGTNAHELPMVAAALAADDEALAQAPYRVLDEWLVVFRDEQGRAVAMQDRCIHRNAQLSLGTVKNGCLTCPYHGWVYDGEGHVVAIPSLGPEAKKLGRSSSFIPSRFTMTLVAGCSSAVKIAGISGGFCGLPNRIASPSSS